MAKNIFRVPHFLKADTDIGIIREMVNNNVKQDKEFDYYLIEKIGTKWYAWYYDTLKTSGKKPVTEKRNINK